MPILWEHEWPGVSIVQPAIIAEGEILVTTSDSGGRGGIGMRRLAIGRGADGWKVEERWSSNGLKPYFNDFVIHDGHAFGFDGSILACISLADGSRAWKGGRYGNGQFVVLADQDVLLVLSEDGELALVRAASDRFTELARFRAIDGKDVDSSRRGRQHPARTQRRGDGCVPAPPRSPHAINLLTN